MGATTGDPVPSQALAHSQPVGGMANKVVCMITGPGQLDAA